MGLRKASVKGHVWRSANADSWRPGGTLFLQQAIFEKVGGGNVDGSINGLISFDRAVLIGFDYRFSVFTFGAGGF